MYRIPPIRWYPFLIVRDAIAEDLIIPHRIASLPAAIGGVALDGVNSAVFHLFHDAHMIWQTIQTAASKKRKLPPTRAAVIIYHQSSSSSFEGGTPSTSAILNRVSRETPLTVPVPST